MKKNIIFIVFGLFQLAINVNAQSTTNSLTRTKKLLKPESLNNNQILLKAKLIDSTKNINVFLINRTVDTLKFFSFYGDNIKFDKEIKNTNGDWVNFDEKNYYRICPTGGKTIKVPKNYYTYEIYKSYQYSGDFNSELRFKFKVNDSLEIKSNTLRLSVDKTLLLDNHERLIIQIKKELELNTNMSQKDKIDRELLLVKHYNKYQQYEKSIVLTDSILKNQSNNDRIRFEAANSVIKYLTKHNESLNTVQKNILISKAINDLKKISKKNHNIYKISDKYIEHYMSLLLNREDWGNESKKNTCLTIKNSCGCYFNNLFSDCIEILTLEK